MTTQREEDILVSTWLFEGIQILIPKRKGHGFLKVPAGHHNESWMSEIKYDIDGLDGYLDINAPCNSWETDKVNAIIAEIIPVILKGFKFKTWKRIDGSEFARRLMEGK